MYQLKSKGMDELKTCDYYYDWWSSDSMDTADGNSLGALSYYTNCVYSVFIIRSDVDLADIKG